MGKKLLSQDLNSDLFGFGDETAETVEESTEGTDSTDLLGYPDDTSEGTENLETNEGSPSPDLGEETTEAIADVPIEEVTEEVTEEGNEDDLASLLKDLTGDSDEIDTKVEEIKEEAKDSGNNELIGTIDDLQSMLAEKTTKIQELSKQLEVSNTTLMDKVGESEELSIYKDVISNLEDNPKLMLLAKYGNGKGMGNPRMKDRIINIVSDLIMEYTGEDISELINKKQADSIGDLSDLGGGAAPIPTKAVPDDGKMLSKEESIENLF